MSDDGLPERSQPLPPSRHGYLSEVSKCIRDYHEKTEAKANLASSIQDLENSASRMRDSGKTEASLDLQEEADRLRAELGKEVIDSLSLLDQISEDYSLERRITSLEEQDRGQHHQEDAIGIGPPKSCTSHSVGLGGSRQVDTVGKPARCLSIHRGCFPFKREDELPVRMFAGEGSAERTNERYHFLANDQPFNRLSVAFDSPSLYGHDPPRN